MVIPPLSMATLTECQNERSGKTNYNVLFYFLSKDSTMQVQPIPASAANPSVKSFPSAESVVTLHSRLWQDAASLSAYQPANNFIFCLNMFKLNESSVAAL